MTLACSSALALDIYTSFRCLALFAWLWIAGTLFFDLAHYSLHSFARSRFTILRRIGHLHQLHHYFFNRRLIFNDRYLWHNLCVEMPLELACQVIGSWIGWVIVLRWSSTQQKSSSAKVLHLVVFAEVMRALVVVATEGRDSNHISYKPTIPKDPNHFIVGPEFHALHHVDPAVSIGSFCRVFDWLFGTALSLRSRRVTMTGASGALGQALKKELLCQSVKCVNELKFGIDWTYEDYSRVIPVLEKTDILILAHGSKTQQAMKANCESPIALIDLFRKHRRPNALSDKRLPEIWYVGSEIELHPSWGVQNLQIYSRSKRAFLPYARMLQDEPSVIYRHIVPSAFQSTMGPGIIPARWVAKVAMWWIHRGACYVPVTYTGIAYLNYFKFKYCIKKVGRTPSKIGVGMERLL